LSPTESLVIRCARPEDAARLADIAEQAWQPVWREVRRQLGDELFEQLHHEAIAHKRRDVVTHALAYPHWFFVAERDGQIVGFMGVRLNMGRDRVVAEIGNNAVDPPVQGQGIATRLYTHALDYFREHGQRYVILTTGLDDAHAPARRAYEKTGMRQACPGVKYILKL
jgi:ribosomal protein S18 acetylase RimI-like enzyme